MEYKVPNENMEKTLTDYQILCDIPSSSHCTPHKSAKDESLLLFMLWCLCVYVFGQ